jgi:hypothetical protein
LASASRGRSGIDVSHWRRVLTHPGKSACRHMFQHQECDLESYFSMV